MIYLIAIAFGLVFGSFLNVCIYRIPRKGSVASPRRSYCPHCEHTLSALDNVPVFSYIFLRGKCRYCKKKISPRYMIVELLTAGLFVLMLHRSMVFRQDIPLMALELAAACVFAALLIVISFIDLEFTIIPDRIVFPGLIAGLLFAIAIAVVKGDFGFLLSRLLGLVVGGGIIYLIAVAGTAVFRKEAMGGGDIKLMALIGVYVGLWPHLLIVLVTASITGSIIGTAMILFRDKKMGSAIPFGPFLAIGALLSLLCGETIWSWYQHVTGLS